MDNPHSYHETWAWIRKRVAYLLLYICFKKIALLELSSLLIIHYIKKVPVPIQQARRITEKESLKHVQFQFKKVQETVSYFTQELAYVRIKISSNTWIGYTAENQEEIHFFNETAFLFWCHALGKLGSSNCCIFEMKNAKGMKNCTKIHFLFIFNLV